MSKLTRLTLSILLTCFSQIALAQAPLINTSYDVNKRTTAKVTALFSRLPTSGYFPVRLELKNAQKSERKWEISFVSSDTTTRYGDSDGSNMESEFEFSCPAGSSKTYDILVPIVTAFPSRGYDSISSGLKVTLSSDGDTQVETLESSQLYNKPSVLLTSSLFIHHAAMLDSYLTSPSSHSYRGHDAAYTSSIDPNQMPSDWQAYVGYDALTCTDKDWTSIGKAAQNAILEWNRLGGKLLILRLNNASNFKTLGISPSTDDSKKSIINRSFGNVVIKDITSENYSVIPDMIRDQMEVAHVNPTKAKSILTDFDRGGWSLQELMGKLSFNPIFLILILVAFGILVGPVNLFVFAKSGERHKLFITTPIIAIGASLVLIVLIVFQDGFGGHGKRVQLIEVRADNGENKAYVKQEQIARTGVVLGSSFETSSPAYITPVPLVPNRYARVTRENHGGNANYIANHGKDGLAVSGDWFQSRSEHGYYLESVISTRARISLKSDSVAPILNSSFDYQIEAILYCDQNGDFWKTDTLEPGKSATLSSITPMEANTIVASYAELLSQTLNDHLMKMYQRKGYFVALTQEAPAIDTLDSINWQRTTSIITGPVVK